MRLPEQDLDHVLEHTADLWPALAGSRIFITGGTGFVGKWLVESLLYANDRLKLGTGVTLLTRDAGRFRAASPHLAEHSAVELLQGDVRGFEASGHYPFVIHAAMEGDDRDVEATRKVLEFAGAQGCKRFLFTSSGAVYGLMPPGLGRFNEDYSGIPVNGYGRAKVASEALCAKAEFDTVIARLFAFIGPYLPLDQKFAAGNFIRDAMAGGPLRVEGNGTVQRSYLYAADLAVWLWTMLVRGQPGRAYNVGSADAVTVGELAHTVANVVGDVAVEIGKGTSGHYVPCVERASSELGLRPLIALEDGVRRTCNWLKTHYH